MKSNKFDLEVERVIEILSKLDPNTDEYQKISENLRNVCDARSKRAGHATDWTTLYLIGGNLILGFGVLYFERIGVLTSKAFGLVRRL